jgi:predicted nucleic acid-binding protein
MPSILLDTNVLVYAFDPRRVEQQEKALAVLLRLEESGAGCLSPQCLSEFCNAAINKLHLPPSEVIPQLERWLAAFPVFHLTPQIVLEAARGVRDHRLAYYDAQIWAAARLNQVAVVFSQDFQDGQVLEGVRFVNPFQAGFGLDAWI